MSTLLSKGSQKEKIYTNIGAQFCPIDLTSAQWPQTQHLDFSNGTLNQCQMTYEANSTGTPNACMKEFMSQPWTKNES